MTSFLVSALHSADVVLGGRRRESREAFRLDVPVEIRETDRSALHPAVRLASYDDRSRTVILLADADHAMWRPHVPAARRMRRDRSDRKADEREAMTAEELARTLRGEIHPTDDPLTRRSETTRKERVPYNGFHRMETVVTRAERYPRLVDADVKTLAWDDRADTETALREAAAAVMLVDGKVWVRQQEPILSIAAVGGARVARVGKAHGVGRMEYSASILDFRIDRFDDLAAWARSREGKSCCPVEKGATTDAIELHGKLEILDPAVLRRDDARIMLTNRIRLMVTVAEQMVDFLPSAAVDDLITISRFRHDRKGAVSTPAAYAGLEGLIAATDSLTGLPDGPHVLPGRLKSLANPIINRWNMVEKRHHRTDAPTSVAPDSVAAPAAFR